MERRYYIEHVMDDIGVPMHLAGYDAILHAIEYHLDNNRPKMMATYAYAGEIIGHSSQQTERNIRHAIAWVLAYGDMDKVHKYFGSSLPSDGRLSNNQFISTLAIHVTRAMRKETAYVDNGR